MMFKKLFIFIVLSMALLLLGYLLVLIQRTSFLESSTYIGSDVIIGFHSLSAIIFLLTFIASKFRIGFRNLLYLVFVCVLFTEITFIALNANGKVTVYKKNNNEILINQKSIQLPINTEDKAWSIINKHLSIQSCISYYGFEKTAKDIGKYWLLTVKDTNPNKPSSCNSTKVLINKQNGNVINL